MLYLPISLTLGNSHFWWRKSKLAANYMLLKYRYLHLKINLDCLFFSTFEMTFITTLLVYYVISSDATL